MKRPLLFLLLSGTLFLAGNAYGQYKFVRKSNTRPADTKTFHYVSKENTGSDKRRADEKASSPADPPVINDPIDIYAENPALIKATLTVHFGAFSKLPGLVDFSLYCDPYYDYHTSAYSIVVSSLQVSNIHADTVYRISLYDRSRSPRSVQYQDFVTKWLDAAHTQLTSAYWANRNGGKIEIQPTGIDGTINKLVLVLQFESGTKTIVWNSTRTFSNDAFFQFDQNFSPK